MHPSQTETTWPKAERNSRRACPANPLTVSAPLEGFGKQDTEVCGTVGSDTELTHCASRNTRAWPLGSKAKEPRMKASRLRSWKLHAQMPRDHPRIWGRKPAPNLDPAIRRPFPDLHCREARLRRLKKELRRPVAFHLN